MDALGPLLQRGVGGQVQHGAQRRRQVKRAGRDVPVVDVLVDRLQRERITFRVVRPAFVARDRGAVRDPGGDRLALVVLEFRGVAGGADHPERPAVGMAHRHAELARPPPRAVAAAVTGVAFEARGLPFEVFGEPAPVQRQVVGVHPRDPVRRLGQHGVVEAEHDPQRRRVIDGVVLDVPVVDAEIEGLQRQRVPLFHLGASFRRSRGSGRYDPGGRRNAW